MFWPQVCYENDHTPQHSTKRRKTFSRSLWNEASYPITRGPSVRDATRTGSPVVNLTLLLHRDSFIYVGYIPDHVLETQPFTKKKASNRPM